MLPIEKFLSLVYQCVARSVLGGVALIGTICEIPEHRKIDRGEKPFRLPFAYRLMGWQIGGPSPGEESEWETSFIFDQRRNRLVLIARRRMSVYEEPPPL